MDQNGFNSFDDLIKFCRNLYEQQYDNQDDSNENSQENSEQCNNCKFGNSNANASESSRNANSDIPGGFQDIPPQLLLVIGELLGNVMAGNLPFNIQNVVMCVCILNIYLRTAYVPSFVFILAHKIFNEALEKNYNVFEVSSKFVKTFAL